MQECLLTYTQYPFVELFRRERNDLLSHYTFQSDDEVELTSLNIRFAVANVYEDVTFPPENDSP